jgi:hypothetical protein
VQHAGGRYRLQSVTKRNRIVGLASGRHTFNSWTPHTQRLALSFHRVRVFGRFAVPNCANIGERVFTRTDRICEMDNLKRTLARYFAYYHETRPHSGLGKQCHFRGNPRVWDGSLRFRNSVGYITAMNEWPHNAGVFLAKHGVPVRTLRGIYECARLNRI